MENKLVISKTYGEYILRCPVIEEGNTTWYNKIARAGTFSDLCDSIADLPAEFYKEGIKVTYGEEHGFVRIPKCEREAISALVKAVSKVKTI